MGGESMITMHNSSTPARPMCFLLLSLIFLSLPWESESQIPGYHQRDLQILLRIKRDWGSPASLSTWTDAAETPCNWTGITCANGFVTEINLPNMSISHPIPSSVCNLSQLTRLDLNWNDINGTFPTELYSCSMLQYLDLSKNFFTGPLPSNIHQLSSLQYLNVTGNNFSGDIPPAIGRLSNLIDLQLGENSFNGSVPKEIGDLSNLEKLSLSNQPSMPLWRIPPELVGLKKLNELRIRLSNLTGEIPPFFSNFIRLVHLDLAMNKLNGEIPRDLFTLVNLQFVYLFGNELTGEIPRKIEALGLTEVDLSANYLTGSIPKDFEKLKNLSTLFLYYNQLSGKIPEGIGQLPSLGVIRLFNNNLTGAIPPKLGLYSDLSGLELFNNRLSGNLPPNLCRAGVLVDLLVNSNNLGGSVPNNLGNCSSLKTVQLNYNAFTGEIPAGLWTTSNLEFLSLSSNSFIGQLPSMLAQNLRQLDISHNHFSGPIPARISESKSLVSFLASSNRLSGPIPTSLTALSKLSRLKLDGNLLSGGIPSGIASWKSLNLLDLSNNQLTGKIPPGMGYLHGLSSLNLSRNQLSGEIPPDLGSVRFDQLDLSSNRLSGKIPDELGSQAFQKSFRNNSRLCALNHRTTYLPLCSAHSHLSANLLFRSVAFISILSCSATVLVTLLVWFVIRDYKERKQIQDIATWKQTSFHRLDFTKSHILQGLLERNLIGSGRSGKVYRIAVGDGVGDAVAVKKIWSGHESQDARLEKDFEAEIQILGKIRHSNIVKLLCCMSSEDSRILVYEYMENGSLYDWLHRKTVSEGGGRQLGWPHRLTIALGAARGLCYLHHSCSPPVVHRDVKSSNILLDAEFNARIADFGLARFHREQGRPETMSAVAGSFGYMAPEFAAGGRANEKCDVYSFGVVLLELAAGREACSSCEECSSLVEWAWKHLSDGRTVEEALDERIRETSCWSEISTVFRLGILCTQTLPSDRPSMKDVLLILQKCGMPYEFASKKGNLDYDVAPLLQPTTPSPSRNKISFVEDEVHLSGSL